MVDPKQKETRGFVGTARGALKALSCSRILFARELLLKTLLSSPANFDALAPLGVDDLMGTDASIGVGIEDRVDDIATPRLRRSISQEIERDRVLMLTLCSDSIGP